jgi:phosphoribosylanthranilate isomerase
MLIEDLIQIAGVIDDAEAEMLLHCGVNCLGFPLRLPVHQEDISEDDAAKIIRKLRPPAFGVLITYLDDAEEIAAFSTSVGACVVQLHGAIDIDELVRRAICEVRPAGVDSHTGVEDENGRKCRRMVEKFIAEAQAGFRLMADGAKG